MVKIGTIVRAHLLVIVIIILMDVCLVFAQSNIDEKIVRVENGLVSDWNDPPWRKMNLVDRMDHYNVSGATITVIDNFEISWTRTYGTIKTGTTDPVAEDTLFQAASLSKPVTALMVLHYVDQEMIDLDNPVNNYLKTWKIPDNEYTASNPVTIRQLLSHTAGLLEYGLPGYASEPYPTLSQILEGAPPANTPPIEVVRTPGEQYVYSNFGYIVLQRLLEDITGEQFETLAENLILDKLGMSSSTYTQPLREDLQDRAAVGHRSNGVPLAERWRVYPEQGAGGLWTTSADLAKFAVEVMLSKHGESNQVISSTMVDTMFSKPLEDSTGLGFGLGDDGGDLKYFLHRGANEGFKGIIVGYYERGQGVVILTNSDNGDLFYDEVLKSVSFEYGWVKKGFSYAHGFILLLSIVLIFFVVKHMRSGRVP
jgi:CubicO group peptidase (beta-lactamase class C family)